SGETRRRDRVAARPRTDAAERIRPRGRRRDCARPARTAGAAAARGSDEDLRRSLVRGHRRAARDHRSRSEDALRSRPRVRQVDAATRRDPTVSGDKTVFADPELVELLGDKSDLLAIADAIAAVGVGPGVEASERPPAGGVRSRWILRRPILAL